MGYSEVWKSERACGMKVTVITVSYNSQDTIQKTIDSVANQTWPNIEHIVIDGASRDSTVEIILRSNSTITHFVSEPDTGVYQAMNKGLKLASGDVIAFLNSDDTYSSPQIVETVVRSMQSKGWDALYGNVEFFHTTDPHKVVRTYDSSRFSPSRIGWGWMPAHPALFLRRAVYEQFGCFCEDFKIAGDYEFVARIFKSGELKSQHIDKVLVRMQTGGLSTAGLAATYRLNKEILRACRQNGISTNWLKVLSKYFFKLRELFPV
jgi:glycosyltransferase involved in cell wall biosynthesis